MCGQDSETFAKYIDENCHYEILSSETCEERKKDSDLVQSFAGSPGSDGLNETIWIKHTATQVTKEHRWEIGKVQLQDHSRSQGTDLYACYSNCFTGPAAQTGHSNPLLVVVLTRNLTHCNENSGNHV